LFAEPTDGAERREQKLGGGIVRAPAAAINSKVALLDQVTTKFEFRTEHDPLDHNYHHVEIRLYRNGTRLDGTATKKLKGVEKSEWRLATAWYQAEMSKTACLLLRAETGTREEKVTNRS
jgi:hypothetical protein